MKTTHCSTRRHYLLTFGIFLTVAVLIGGMVACSRNGVQYDLSIATTTGGSVIAPGEGMFSFNEGTIVNLVAEAEEGCYFARWTGDVGTMDDANTAETTITVSGDYSIIANFVPDDVEPVWDWHDLDAIRNSLSANYLLMNDLDSTTFGYAALASPTANSGLGWQPIGVFHLPFTGTFNGQGYNIRELYIFRPSQHQVGLFGELGEGGSIKDIGVVNSDVTGDYDVGGLVGENDGGTISNSHFTGSVVGERHGVGGLVGDLSFGAVTDSYCDSNVTGDAGVGGFVGLAWHGTVTNCYSTGSVTGDIWYAGGLVGALAFSTVSKSHSRVNVIGATYVGGLVGVNGDEGFTGTVNCSYSVGSVTGYDYVGGLVGFNHEGSVIDSYSTGDVTGDQYVGGLVGSNLDNVSNSFWDIETSGQAASDGGTGKNTTEMLDITTYSVWNITAVANSSTRNTGYIWNIVDDETYPFLSWQPVS